MKDRARKTRSSTGNLLSQDLQELGQHDLHSVAWVSILPSSKVGRLLSKICYLAYSQITWLSPAPSTCVKVEEDMGTVQPSGQTPAFQGR